MFAVGEDFFEIDAKLTAIKLTANRSLTASLLAPEIRFSSSRSSGPGGQNVNKVNTKVILKFDIIHSSVLTPDEKQLLLHRLSNRITAEGILMLSAQEGRSQLANKEAVIAKFDRMLAKAIEKRKARKSTKPSKQAIRRRAEEKKRRSETKKWRRRPI